MFRSLRLRMFFISIVLIFISRKCVGALARSCWTRQRAYWQEAVTSDFQATDRDKRTPLAHSGLHQTSGEFDEAMAI